MFDRIPVIDLERRPDGSSSARPERLGEQLLNAYSTVGFGYVVGHGIDAELVEAVFEQSRRFHALPHSVKMGVELNGVHRGFIPMGVSTDVTSTLATVTKPNQSESFMMMREAGPDDPEVLAGAYLAGPNQWPADLAEFRVVLERYHDAMCALAQHVVAALGSALGDTDGAIAGSFDPPTTWLRLLHYPPRPANAPDDLYGSAPHIDFGCITLLAQDANGGLQVQTPDERWVDAPPMPGSFVVNVGTMLHRWSNGRLLATPHRVINRSGHERYSVPFFYDPNVATVIDPLACCIAPNRPAQFPPVRFDDFLRHELESSYLHHGAEPAP